MGLIVQQNLVVRQVGALGKHPQKLWAGIRSGTRVAARGGSRRHGQRNRYQQGLASPVVEQGLLLGSPVPLPMA